MASETRSCPERKDGSATEDHETLKYHLLGPSLTKAGQDTVDQQKVGLWLPSLQYQSY